MVADRSKLYDNPRSKKKAEQQEAKKGDVREIDNSDDPSNDKIKGQYESVGTEGREEGDSEKISDEDNKQMSKATDAWIKGGKKGPAPSFKAAPSKNVPPDPKGEGDRYEMWRRREKKEDVPTS